MAKTLAVEATKHAASGFKTRHQDEISRIKTLCQSCENVFYDDKLGKRCRICGCTIRAGYEKKRMWYNQQAERLLAVVA